MTSGITGFTFPGIMEDPGCMAGRLISPSPQRGPEANSLRSLQILFILTATRRMAEEYPTMQEVSEVAPIRSSASLISNPVILRRAAMHFSAYSGSAVIPVPMAVAPMLTVRKSCAAKSRFFSSCSRILANPLKVCPSVIGTASSSWVRPILMMCANSAPFFRKASISVAKCFTNLRWV